MIDLFRKFSETISFYREHYDRDNQHWQDIKKKMRKRMVWNFITVVFFVGITALWHFYIRPVKPESWGILLVGVGAVRLALVSARVHMREFYDSSHSPEAVRDRRTEEYRPRVAGKMVDALSGFVLVAIGFTIRVGAEFI